MKRKITSLWIAALSLAGCSRDVPVDKPVSQQPVFPLQFAVRMEKETLHFPETRSIPAYLPDEPSVVRSGEEISELNELCSQIEYVVFTDTDSNPELLKRKTFRFDPSDMDADFGIVYDTLPQGNYRFCFLAHNSDSTVLSETTFAFDTVSDAFYKQLAKTISPAEIVHEDVVLERMVSRIEFMAIDTVPTDLKRFDMEISGMRNRFELLSGTGVGDDSLRIVSRQFTSADVGQQNLIHAFYTFAPAGEEKIAVRLTSIALNGDTIRERQVRNIVPVRNRIVRYKGRLYHRSESNDTFGISIYNNGAWEETVEEVLPEE